MCQPGLIMDIQKTHCAGLASLSQTSKIGTIRSWCRLRSRRSTTPGRKLNRWYQGPVKLRRKATRIVPAFRLVLLNSRMGNFQTPQRFPAGSFGDNGGWISKQSPDGP